MIIGTVRVTVLTLFTVSVRALDKYLGQVMINIGVDVFKSFMVHGLVGHEDNGEGE